MQLLGPLPSMLILEMVLGVIQHFREAPGNGVDGKSNVFAL